MHSRISHVVMAIAIGGDTISALKYLRLSSLYRGNGKPFITTDIPSGAGDNRFCVQ
jgi:hypothetical protein